MTKGCSMIRFGTDGWRAVISDEFTVKNVQLVAHAIASYLTKNISTSPKVTIGYDTRFHSKYFAETVAKILELNGCNVILSDCFLSTPALSSSVVDAKADGGIMISASHNPPEYNGIKFKTSLGGSAPEEVTKEFEQFISNNKIKKQKKTGSIAEKNLVAAYLKRVASAVDMGVIKKKELRIIADPMYGAGIGYLSSLLAKTKSEVSSIHSCHDPLFGGLHPEPIAAYLEDLQKAVVRSSSSVGLATDGDADRLGVVDDKGTYLTPHQVFSLLLYYLCHYKKLRGKVVQTISLGFVSERIARDYNLPWEEVSIGFKYIAERIVKEKILMGGEESGGYGYGNYLPERDGILNSMMIVEMLAFTGKPLSVLLKEMEKKYGKSCYLRTDFKNPGIAKDVFVKTLRENAPSKIGGIKIKNIKSYDGIEFVLEDDSWLLLRPSGTEPIIRVYAESESLQKTTKIIEWGKKEVSALKLDK
jgi:phosphomannomutase